MTIYPICFTTSQHKKELTNEDEKSITSKHGIFVCGLNRFHQLGKSNNNVTGLKIVYPPIKLPLDPDSLLSYSASYRHSVLVVDDCTLLGAGSNGNGEIGSGFDSSGNDCFTSFSVHDNRGVLIEPISAVCTHSGTLYLLSSSYGNDCQLVLCDTKPSNWRKFSLGSCGKGSVFLYGGEYHCAGIRDDGLIMFVNHEYIQSSGNPSYEFSCLPDNEKAEMMACLESFVVVLGSSGKIFISQIEYRGQELNFFVIEEVEDLRFVWVSGSNKHCLAVTKDGRVFGYGSNERGQLGFPKEVENVSSFTVIDSLSGFEIVAAYAGSSHSLFQTKDGKILSCGSNDFGELMLSSGPSDQCVYKPKLSMITEGARFCIAGIGFSVVFVFCDPPLNTPNMKVRIDS